MSISFPSFVLRMTSKGIIVDERIEQSGLLRSTIAKKLGISRHTLRNWVIAEDIDWDKVLRIGKIIDYDFSIDFPELKGFVGDQPALYKTVDELLDPNCHALLEAKDQVIAAKDKHIEVLEKLLSAQEKLLAQKV